MSNSLHLSLKYRQVIEKMVLRFIPDVEVWAYGSRVTGKNHDGSDLDLILRGPNLEKIDAFQLQDFTEAIKESTIPILVEARDWARVPKRFHKEINDNHYVLYRPDHFNNITTFGDCAMLVKNVVQPNINTNDLFVGLEHIEKHTLVLSGHGFAKDVSSQKYRFLKGDILFGKLNPYFRKVVRVRFDGICSTDIWVVRPQKGVDSKFLFYLMASMEFIQWVSKGSEGTSLPRAKWDYVSRFKLNLPPTHSQRKIACILSALDDKFELNRRMNKSLEMMTEAIFKDWFVDFGPTRAKTEGRIPYLTPEFWNLFPESLDAKGKPEEWKVSPLENWIYILDSKRIPLSGQERKQRQGPYAYHGATGIMDYVDDYLFEGVHILLGEDGSVVKPNGKPFTQYVWGRFWVNNHAHVLRGKGISNDFLLCFLKQLNISPYVTGAVQPKLNQKNLKLIPLSPYGNNTFVAFDKAVSLLFEKIKHNFEENRILIQIRDFLLSKLISGDIHIRKTDKISKLI